MRKRFFDPDLPCLLAEKFYFCSPTLRFGVSTRGSEYHKVFFNCFQMWISHFWGKFSFVFFFQKFLFLILFPKFHSQLVILVHFLVKISFLAFSSHLWFYSFTFRLRFQVVAKRFKIFQIRSNEISWKFEKTSLRTKKVENGLIFVTRIRMV